MERKKTFLANTHFIAPIGFLTFFASIVYLVTFFILTPSNFSFDA